MTKEVVVTVLGMQKSPHAGEAPQEVISKAEGVFYEKNGKKYVLFEEQEEETNHTTKNTVKLDGKSVELIRRGALSTHMLFESGVDFPTEYKTPYGSMMLNIVTKNLTIFESDEQIKVTIKYELRSNENLLSDCSTVITVKAGTES
ncbi:MAG: DUF1934 domain-containing protein [bacterium]|nr:DUF1934 domain-containing protein [bacterium]